MFKLGDWLADPDVIAMLTSGMVRSLTYKANQYGPNITKDEAIANSAAWYEIDPEEANLGAALDALPTAAWDEETTSEPASTPGSSAPGSSVRRLMPRHRLDVAVALAVALAVAVAVATRSRLCQTTCSG